MDSFFTFLDHREVYRGSGFQVTTAIHGKDALEKVQKIDAFQSWGRDWMVFRLRRDR